MEIEVIAGFLSFVALIVVWAVAPSHKEAQLRAPALQPEATA